MTREQLKQLADHAADPASGDILFLRTGTGAEARILLEMSVTDYAYLMRILITGFKRRAPASFYNIVKFVNRLNQHNDLFRPFEIPEKYR